MDAHERKETFLKGLVDYGTYFLCFFRLEPKWENQVC
jgi:hypothetical protein